MNGVERPRGSEVDTIGWTLRSREKGASLFTMIPLERWNVERETLSAARVHREEVPADSVRSPIRHEERKLRRRSTDLWNAVLGGVAIWWHAGTPGVFS